MQAQPSDPLVATAPSSIIVVMVMVIVIVVVQTQRAHGEPQARFGLLIMLVQLSDCDRTQSPVDSSENNDYIYLGAMFPT